MAHDKFIKNFRLQVIDVQPFSRKPATRLPNTGAGFVNFFGRGWGQVLPFACALHRLRAKRKT